jgi:O-antigen ligase
MWTALRLVAPATGDRMADLQKAVGASETVSNPQASSAVRIAVWRTTWQLIRSQPLLGTGAGDIKDELIAAYAAEGASFSAEHRFNAHNQFLQTWLATGIIGLLLLLGTLFFPTLQYRLYPEPAWVLFIVLSAFNMAVESLLERQDGVVFFALFYSVFLIRFAHSRHSGDL